MEESAHAEQAKEKEFPKVLSMREKIAYGVGDVGNNFLFEMGQLYLLKYFTDVLGLPAATAGGVFLVAKVWDAFADISVGTVIDHRKNIGKRGRFRPFMLWAALPLAVLLIANFSVPDFSLTGKEIWSYITYMLFGTVYSISNIAFGSMQPTMTKNSIERSQLASWRNMGSNFGTLVATVAFMPIVLMLPTEKYGYTVAAIVFAILGVACQLYSYANIKEHYSDDENEKNIINENKPKGIEAVKEVLGSFKAVFHNGPLLILCVANLLTFSAYNVKLAVQFYFAQYVLHDIRIISYMSFFTIGFSIFASAMIPFFTKRLGKKNTYILGCLIWAVSDTIGFFSTNSAITFAIFTSVSYFGNGLITGLNWALISDVVEYGEWKTEVRSEGIVYSSYTYFRKLSQAAAGVVPGIVLTLVGYVPNHVQTTRALGGIRGLIFIYPVVMALLTVILMSFYPITERKYAKIISDLRIRHQHVDANK